MLISFKELANVYQTGYLRVCRKLAFLYIVLLYAYNMQLDVVAAQCTVLVYFSLSGLLIFC